VQALVEADFASGHLGIYRFTVEEDEVGVRLDQYLADQPEIVLSRSQIKKLLDAAQCTVDGHSFKPSYKLKLGEHVILCVPPPEPLSLEPEPMDLAIRHEDEEIIVLCKPKGLVVHPAPGHPRGTLVNGLLYAHPMAGGDPFRPGIVHRLDKDTSGLMVVAKTAQAHAALAEQFHVHSVDRRYQVLVCGAPPDKGTWSTFHGRHPTERKLFTSKLEKGKRAVSDFTVAERFEGAARLVVTLHTGRTHQVRVHCHDHGFPVLGDMVYSPKKLSSVLAAIHQELAGQALHAELLAFDHPRTGQRLRFEEVWPLGFENALQALRNG
jgi:23S rRNA pseudouridine1911/1915/1917 synthase